MTARLLMMSLLLSVGLPIGSAPAVQAAGLAIGDRVPGFKLTAGEDRTIELKSLSKDRHVVVMFIATRCPYSNAYNQVMADLTKRYAGKPVAFVGINSNPTEPAEEVERHAGQSGFSFPVLKDPDHKVADAWKAQVTPEVFVISPRGELVYHGALGNSRAPTRDRTRANSGDLDSALSDLLAGRQAARPETKAFGCTIKRGVR